MNTLHKSLLLVAITAASLTGIGAILPTSAHAVSPSDWKAGRIIEDYLFTETSGVTAADIQTEINAIAPTCDTNGSQTSELYAPPSADTNNNGVISRAEYGAYKGNPAPFTCLKDYRENPNNGQSNYGGGSNPAGSKSAAQLIVDAGNNHNISPKALVVMLRKESAVLIDSWPFLSQYQYAMGARCPDGPGGAECDPNYAGFAIQMDESARLLRYYLDNMDEPWWSHKKPGVNNILWNTQYFYYTNGSGNSVQCGGSNVNIETYATAALYTYTPYQPNTASLNVFPAGVSSGSSFSINCASYGNRNFWYFYNEMFGPTNAPNVTVTQELTLNPSVPFIGQSVTAKFSIRNNENHSVFVGDIGVAVRNTTTSDGLDFPKERDLTIAAGQTYNYEETQTINNPGDHRFWIANYRPETGWVDDWPFSNSQQTTELNLPISDVTFTESFSLTPGVFNIGQPVTAKFKIRNNEASSVFIGDIGVAVRNTTTGSGSDFVKERNLTLSAGQVFTYEVTKTFNTSGDYRFWVASMRPETGWVDDWPYDSANAIGDPNEINQNMTDVTVTKGLEIGDGPQNIGDVTTAKFTIKNNGSSSVFFDKIGVAARSEENVNVDFPKTLSLTLSPGQSYEFEQERIFNTPGDHHFWIATYRPETGWVNDWPVAVGGQQTDADHYISHVTMSTSLAFDSPIINVGTPITATFNITNHDDQAIEVGDIGVVSRNLDGEGSDFPKERDLVIAANQTYSYSESKTYTDQGIYELEVKNYRPETGWVNDWPKSTSNIIRTSLMDAHDTTLTTSLQLSPANPIVGETTTATFEVRNTSDQPVFIGDIGVAVRDDEGNGSDFAKARNLTLAPGQTYSYSEDKVFDESGPYRVWVTSKTPELGWSSDWPVSQSAGLTRELRPLVMDVELSDGLSISTAEVGSETVSTATFSITNLRTTPVFIGDIGVAVRDDEGNGSDFAKARNLTLAPGQTYSYSEDKVFDESGPYRVWVTSNRGSGWDDEWPRSAPAVVREKNIDDTTLTTSLQLSPANPIVGETTTATFEVRNTSDQPVFIGDIGVAVRDDEGNGSDFAKARNLTLAPGQTYSYSEDKVFDESGPYRVWVTSNRGSGWDDEWPRSAESNLERDYTATALDSELSEELTVSIVRTANGPLVLCRFEISNPTSRPVEVGDIGVAVRETNTNDGSDLPKARGLSLSPGASHEYLEASTLDDNKDFTLWITSKKPEGQWSEHSPFSSNDDAVRSIDLQQPH